MGDLLRQSLKASIWSSAAEVAAKVISPLVFLVLTRLLSPSDFGVVAVATTILTFTNIIVDIGTSKVIIQSQLRKNFFTGLCDTAFWINIIFGFILFVLCYLGSNWLAELNNSPQSANVIKVMSLQIIFNSLSIVQTSLFKRNLNFKVLFLIRLVTIGTPALISIPIAFYGGGYWSIVIGSVSGSAMSCITLWMSSDWKPNFRKISHQISLNFKSLFSKSIWTTIDQIISYLPLALDTYLISNYLGDRDLGLYSSSRTLFSASISLTLAPIIPVLFTSFSKIVVDPTKLKNAILTSQKIIFTLAATIGIFVYGFRKFITNILFDTAWNGIDECIGIIFLIFGVEYFYASVVEGVRATGQFKGLAINTSICTILTILFLIVAVRWGLNVYILTRSLCLFLWYPGVFILAKKTLHISIVTFINNTKIEILAWIFMLVYFIFTELYLNSTTYLVLGFFVFCIYIVFIYFDNKSLISSLIKNLSHKYLNKNQ